MTEEDLEAIASDAVEIVTREKNLDVSNKGKSIVARAIADSLKEIFAE